jgi:hypothetical protein
VLLIAGRTRATLELPVTPKTVKATAASVGDDFQDGLACVVHIPNASHAVPLSAPAQPPGELPALLQRRRRGLEATRATRAAPLAATRHNMPSSHAAASASSQHAHTHPVTNYLPARSPPHTWAPRARRQKTTGSPAIELSACLSLITHPPERRSTVRRNSSRHSSLSPLSAHAKRTHAKNVHATLLANTRVCARANRDLMSLSVGRARRLLQHGNPMENPTEPRESTGERAERARRSFKATVKMTPSRLGVILARRDKQSRGRRA